MSGGTIRFESTKYISKEEHKLLTSRCCPEKGDLLLSKVGTTGVPALIQTETPFSIFVSIALIKFFNEYIHPDFLVLMILSPLVQEQAKNNTRGVGNKNWVLTAISDTFLVIPPYQEQLRIIRKVNSLKSSLDRYDNFEKQLNNLNINLCNRMKQSILQESIQGRLVPQIESEGTAEYLLEEIRAEKMRLVKEGKLKKSAIANESRIFRGEDNKYYEKRDNEIVCIDDEVPFEIPPKWAWVRLDDICTYIQRGKSPKYSLVKKIPVVAQKCNQWSGFQIEKAQFIEPSSLSAYGEDRYLQNGDLMWNSTGLGTLGRIAVYKESLNPYGIAVADSHVTVIRPVKEKILSDYLYSYFSSSTVQTVIEDKSDGSTKQKELATSTVKNYLVPLPPTAEQIRIVDKIEEVLASIMSR